MTPDDTPSELDSATTTRLRKLSTMPVELAGLQARIERDIPRPAIRRRLAVGWRGASAIAASVAVMVLVGSLVVTTASRPALASPEALADVFRSSGDAMDMRDTGTAGKDGMPTMACCIRKVGQQPLTCMTLDLKGKRVSMAVADAKRIAAPKEALTKTVNGVEYRYQSSKTVNMVMAVKNGAFVCMMGEVDVDDLIQLLARTPVR